MFFHLTPILRRFFKGVFEKSEKIFFTYRRLGGNFTRCPKKFLYLTSFFSCFCTPFFAAFAKQQISFDGFLRDSVKVWLYRFTPNPSWKAVLQGRSQKFFKFSLAPYNTADGRIANRGERKICGVSRLAGLGEGTPQQDHHKGENEQ